MSLPSFLEPLTPIHPLQSTASVKSPVGGSAGSRSLPFNMQIQQESNWCWAATTSSVSAFYDPSSGWTQCNVATACLGQSCCVTSAPCNQTFTLDGPLGTTSNLANFFNGGDSWGNVQQEIDQSRLVCCHIGWFGGGGHFVAISGYDSLTADLYIDDPLYGSATVPYSTFLNSYRGSGQWDFSYYTQP